MAGKTAASKVKPNASGNSARFEPARLQSLFPVLDAIAWMDASSVGDIAQFAGIDPRTAGKLVKNSVHIGLVDSLAGRYVLNLPYPFKGTQPQKESVVREALVKLPLLVHVRQFLLLGDRIEVALRKAATLAGIRPFNSAALNPLLEWAQALGALKPSIVAEDLVQAAETEKEKRHQTDRSKRVAFLSHSSADKPFVRQLAADLDARGVDVWLDEQRIRVGDSIPEKIAQGLAESDYFLIAISKSSVSSDWVKKELNSALMSEVSRRKTKILPIKLDESEMPSIISDKKYANFSTSYKSGLEELIDALAGDKLNG